MRPIVMHPAAREELIEVVNRFEDIASSLADQFREEYRGILLRIRERPELYRIRR